MAHVSYLRPSSSSQKAPSARRSGASGARRRAPWIIGGVVAVLCALAAVAIIFSTASAKIVSAPTAVARVDLPIGGGSVQSVVATTGVQNDEHFVHMLVKGDPMIYPAHKLTPGERLTLTVTVRRPGWISWLAGRTQRLTRTVTVPSSRLRDGFVTLSRSGALRVHFSSAVRTIAYGRTATTLHRRTLAHPVTSLTLPHTGTAGTMYVAATVERWERGRAHSVSWFPAGTKASAVATPAAGATVRSDTPITLTFSKPVSTVLGHRMPTLTPAGSGTWHTISSHAIRFVPTGYGYGLGQKVSVSLPAGVRLTGGSADGSASTGTWNVPDGSTARLQQMLAQLGYLPLNVEYTAARPADTVAAQESAAEQAPAATLSWTYGDTPASLKSQWYGENTPGELTKGALMMFQDQHDLAVTGYEDTETWNALFKAIDSGDRNQFGYTFVAVHEADADESLYVWHSGKVVLSGIPVNTGVPGATTQTGTFAVFEHQPSVTMIGTNVDGSHYDDPDVKWVSFFNGGDALHYFDRPDYGHPQSNGCVEMSLSDAARVYPFTPIGTIVQVATS